MDCDFAALADTRDELLDIVHAGRELRSRGRLLAGRIPFDDVAVDVLRGERPDERLVLGLVVGGAADGLSCLGDDAVTGDQYVPDGRGAGVAAGGAVEVEVDTSATVLDDGRDVDRALALDDDLVVVRDRVRVAEVRVPLLAGRLPVGELGARVGESSTRFVDVAVDDRH